MLIGIIYLYTEYGTTDYFILLTKNIEYNTQLLLFLAFFASFAIKIPKFPFHI